MPRLDHEDIEAVACWIEAESIARYLEIEISLTHESVSKLRLIQLFHKADASREYFTAPRDALHYLRGLYKVACERKKDEPAA